jgi:hypothetical protein
MAIRILACYQMRLPYVHVRVPGLVSSISSATSASTMRFITNVACQDAGPQPGDSIITNRRYTRHSASSGFSRGPERCPQYRTWKPHLTCRPLRRSMPRSRGGLGRRSVSRIGSRPRPTNHGRCQPHFRVLFHASKHPHVYSSSMRANSSKPSPSKHFKRCSTTPRHERAKRHKYYGRTALLDGHFWRVLFLLPMINSETAKCQDLARERSPTDKTTILIHTSLTSSLRTAMAPHPARTCERK